LAQLLPSQRLEIVVEDAKAPGLVPLEQVGDTIEREVVDREANQIVREVAPLALLEKVGQCHLVAFRNSPANGTRLRLFRQYTGQAFGQPGRTLQRSQVPCHVRSLVSTSWMRTSRSFGTTRRGDPGLQRQPPAVMGMGWMRRAPEAFRKLPEHLARHDQKPHGEGVTHPPANAGGRSSGVEHSDMCRREMTKGCGAVLRLHAMQRTDD